MKCPNCNARMNPRGYTHVTRIGALTVKDGTGMAPTCDACGEASLSTEQLAGYERRAAKVVLTEGGKVSGDVLKFARKALGMRQTDLAKILGTNDPQVSRWEKLPELAMDLRLAVARLLDIVENDEPGGVEQVGSNPETSFEVRKAS
jgi:DNA-binding transcriptional regulator YiaG